MDPSKLQLEIRLLMSSIKLYIAKLPAAKQQKAFMKFSQSASSMPHQANIQQLNQILKDLQFQANFLKLSNPGIQCNIIIKKKINQVQNQEQELKGEVKFIENFDEVLNKEDDQSNPITGSGTYVYKDGKLVPGKAEKKIDVDYSNWHAGNVDPQDLKKHKELLDRQNFRGPFWEGKPIPKSVLNEENPFQKIYDDEEVKPEIHPGLKGDKEERWETVKR